MASFKEKVKTKYNDAKTKVKAKYNQVKDKAINYVDDLGSYYQIGYKKGWNDCKSGNSPFGSSFVGGVGYGVGFRNRKRLFKYQQQQRTTGPVKR